MFYPVPEYQFDFLVNSYVAPSDFGLRPWQFQKAMFIAMKSMISTRSSLLGLTLQALWVEGFFSEGLVLFCCSDWLEEDLCRKPRLGAFVDLVEYDDGVAS